MTTDLGARFDIEVYDYLRQPYARIIVPEDDGSYRGEIMEFPGCIANGEDAASALYSLEGVASAWITSALESGQPIPDPIELSSDFSGRLALRIPRSLHKKAAWYAEREGVSLNQFILYSLAESVGERRPSTNMFVAVYSTATQPKLVTSLPLSITWTPSAATTTFSLMRSIGGSDA